MTTLKQILVPDEQFGRFSSVSNMFSSLSFVAGLGITGPVVELVGAQQTLIGVGVLALLLGAVFAIQPLARVDKNVETIRS